MATESKKEKKPNIFKRIGAWFKHAGLELKKVSWPKAKDVFKKFGIVLAVVAFFFVVLMIMDIGLQIGYRALLGFPEWWNFWSGANTMSSTAAGGGGARTLLSIFKG